MHWFRKTEEKEGLVLSHTIKENAILPISAQLVKMGYLMMIRQHMISLKKYPGSGSCSRQYESGDQAALRWKPAEDCYCKMVKFNPKIFMFDEPTAGVDIVAKGEIISIIREFADKGWRSNFCFIRISRMMAICDDIITILMERSQEE